MPYKDSKKRDEYRRNYYLKNREKLILKGKKRRNENLELYLKRGKDFYQKNRKNILEKRKQYRIANLETILPKKREEHRLKVRKIKIEILSHYSNGNIECKCCGEKEILFLSIDHINGGGNKERKSLKVGNRGGYKFYIYLKKKKYPIGYQVLCMNCNMGKHHNKGVCPHKNHD